ncbi:uncharacterized protein LOC128276427, partial [Anopheles cruzii]|uniref:uncharacterized protein LOC128276427 n=1 Tax=Anopheles cruzii TaxID=68878 RepID=UPI0022EC2766
MFNKCIIILCMTSIINAHFIIYDLTKNPLAIIPLGKAQIKVGHLRILHPFNIQQIEDIIDTNYVDLAYNVDSGPLYSIIHLKLQRLHETFCKIKPNAVRRKRWEAIGTVWKWIAGNPDAEDLRIINSTLNSLIKQNNKQVLINEGINSRLQDITTIANNVLTLEHERFKQRSIELQQLIIISNLDSLQNHLESIEEAIILAKHGIPSSKILSMEELKEMMNFLSEHNISISSPEEMLAKSTAQVTMNTTHVIYMLKYPQTSKYTFEYNYVNSIITNKKRILLRQNHFIQNQTHIFELLQPCKEEDRDLYICASETLQQPSECVQRIIQGNHSDCVFEKVYSDGIIKRIDETNILINDAIAEISSNCSNINQQLQGSFLIQFSKCSLYINGEEFTNFETTIPARSYHPTLGLMATEVNVIDEPPAKYLNNLTLEHRDKLKTISLQNNSLSWKINLFGSLSGIAIIASIAVFIFCFISIKRKQNISIHMPSNITPMEKAETYDKMPISFH